MRKLYKIDIEKIGLVFSVVIYYTDGDVIKFHTNKEEDVVLYLKGKLKTLKGVE